MLYLQKAAILLLLGSLVSGQFFNTSSPQNASSSIQLDEHTIQALAVLDKTPDEYRLPGSLPDPRSPPGTHLLQEIKHIVWIMLENHSWDNIYGTLNRQDAEGYPFDRCTGRPAVSNPFANGTILWAYEANQTCIRTPNSDAPTQNYLSSHLQYDNGSMNGFVDGNGFKPIQMAYHTKSQLPFMHALGQIFPVMDRYFCSLLGPTWPNRRFFISGTAAGVTATGQNLTTLPTNITTIFAEMTRFNISWRNYVPGFGTPAAEEDTPALYPIDNAIAEANGRSSEQFFADAASGNLPAFSFIDTNGTWDSGENPQNVVHMEANLASIVRALGNSPSWNNTLLLVNFDEHGGYFDHVPPPVAIVPDDIPPVPPAGDPVFDAYHRYGFRVPAVMVSPYAKKDFVSHLVYDHTSALALVERVFNLPALTKRDANALDMLDTIDLDAMKLGEPTFPDLNALGLPPAGDTPAQTACDYTTFLVDTAPVGYIGGTLPTNCTYPIYANESIS